jgi:hypothetical protein
MLIVLFQYYSFVSAIIAGIEKFGEFCLRKETTDGGKKGGVSRPWLCSPVLPNSALPLIGDTY